MLTQGWSRFDILGLIGKKQKQPEFLMEMQNVISGHVTNSLGRPEPNRVVSLFIDDKLFNSVKTDPNGCFFVKADRYADSDRIRAELIGRSRLINSEVKLDREFFPKFINLYPYKHIIRFNDQQLEYMESLVAPYIMEDGVLMVNLPQVTIKAQHIIKENFSSYALNDPEEIAQKKGVVTALDLLRKTPGFYVIHNIPYINPKYSQGKISSRRARIRLDNKTINYKSLSKIDASEIAGIYKIDPETDDILDLQRITHVKDFSYDASMDSGSEALTRLEKEIYSLKEGAIESSSKNRKSGGVIDLVSHSGRAITPLYDSRIDRVYLKGIDTYKERYHPHSESDKHNPITDSRTTLYWQPRLRIDSNGRSTVQFYTAGIKGSYTVVIEGLTKEGIPSRYEFLLGE